MNGCVICGGEPAVHLRGIRETTHYWDAKWKTYELFGEPKLYCEVHRGEVPMLLLEVKATTVGAREAEAAA